MSELKTAGSQIIHQATALVAVVFARKSPERLIYTQRRLYIWLFAALLAAYLAHTRLLGLDTPHALLKLVCELGVLVVGLNLAWRTRASHQKLVRMTMTLFMISTLGDAVLLLLSLVPLESDFGPTRQAIAFVMMLAMTAGAINTLQYALAVSWRIAGSYALGYIAVALLFYDLTQRLI